MYINATLARYQDVYPVEDTVGDLNDRIAFLIYAWYKCLAFIQKRVPTLPTLILRIGCPLIEKTRYKEMSVRPVAHTNHLPNTVCVHPSLAWFPEPFIWGILMHEIGHNLDQMLHIVDDADNQARADITIHRVSGLNIIYRGPQTLEYLSQHDIDKIVLDDV